MQFRWLGPLQVGPAGQIRGARERRLLALLLLESPSSVSRAAAGDWINGSPGASASASASASALNVAVSRLRRQLAELAPDATIESRNGQLRLCTAPGSMDSARFGELLARARALPLGGTARAQAFDEALGLWRDVPLLGEDLPPHPGIDALLEVHCAAVEDRFEARLAADDDGLDVSGLLTSCRAQPYRERLWALGMRALYRNGRQADALALYQEARNNLVTALGIEPGAELADTEARILRHDPALRRTSPTGDTGASSPLTELIGRDNELAMIETTMRDRRLVNLVGPGGVGKTRLARAVFERLASRSESALFMRLDAVARAGNVIRPLLTQLEVPGRPGVAPEDVLLDHLAGGSMLIVLDNCEHVLDSAANTAQLILAASPHTRVLATSREPLGIPGEAVHPVSPLPVPRPDDENTEDPLRSPAVRLFLERAADAAPGQVAWPEDGQLVVEIVRRVEGLPLAIEIAAASLRNRSLAGVVDGLSAERVPLQQLRGVSPRHRTLDAALTWSRELLTPADTAALDRLSAFAGWFDNADATELFEYESEHDAADTIARLVAASLVSFTPQRPKGHRLLEPIRAHCRAQLAMSAANVDASVTAHFHWCIKRSTELGAGIDGPDQLAVLRTIDAMLPDLRRAVAVAVTRADWAVLALRIANPLTRYWWLRTSFAEGRDWFADLLRAAQPAEPSVELTAPALTGMGFLQLASGDETGAVNSLETAVKQWRSCSTPAGLPVTLHYLARAVWGVYPPEAVLALIEEAAATLDTVACPADAFIVYILATMWHCMYGDPRQASTAAQHTWKYATRSGAPNSLAHAHEALALAACARQESAAAATELAAAQQIYRRLGNLGCAAHCLEFTAWQQAQAGQPDTALHLLAAAAHARTLHAAPIASYEFIGRAKTLELLDLDEAAIPTAPPDMTLDNALLYALAAADGGTQI